MGVSQALSALIPDDGAYPVSRYGTALTQPVGTLPHLRRRCVRVSGPLAVSILRPTIPPRLRPSLIRKGSPGIMASARAADVVRPTVGLGCAPARRCRDYGARRGGRLAVGVGGGALEVGVQGGGGVGWLAPCVRGRAVRVRRRRVIALFVVLGRVGVVFGGAAQVLGGLLVVLGRGFGHDGLLVVGELRWVVVGWVVVVLVRQFWQWPWTLRWEMVTASPGSVASSATNRCSASPRSGVMVPQSWQTRWACSVPSVR